MGMEISSGTAINKLVGMGQRLNPETGEKELVTNFYPKYFEKVALTFRTFPVTKTFGITVEDAMRMSVDRWDHIRKIAETLPQNKFEDNEAEVIRELIKLVRDVIAGKGGTE